MKTTLLLTATLFLSGLAAAATPATGDAHAAHHPPVAAAKEEATKADKQISAMRDMHAKMLAAKTPEERAVLMDEHMKAMQNGMAMMGSMSGKGDKAMRGGKAMGSSPDMMARRMEMMEIMMQMMMDREAMKPAASK